MADFTKLEADLATLSGKVDTFIASDAAKDAEIADLKAQLAAPQPPVDEQPLVDAADTAVGAILAKLPA